MGHRTSLLIPCYNESANIPELCERLKALQLSLDPLEDFEIVFVDDGSTDGTAEVIDKSVNGFPRRVIRHPDNRGIGAALRTGFEAAQGEEIVTIDSDGTYDPMTIPRMLEMLRSGFDVVTASPYHPQGEVVDVENWRIGLSRLLSLLYGLVLPQRLHTYTSCYRAYRREALGSITLRNNGFLGVTELLVSGILNGARVGELPARLTRRRLGSSKISVIKVSFDHLRYILQVVWSRLRVTPRSGEVLPLIPENPSSHHLKDHLNGNTETTAPERRRHQRT